MATLLMILVVLFLCLALVVVLTQRFGKPLEPEQQQRYGRWIWILVGLLLLAQVLRHYLGPML